MSNDYGFGLTGPRIEKQYSNSNKPIDNPAELLALVNAEAGKGQETAVKALREKMPVERRSALLKQLTLNNLYDLVKKHGKTYDYGYMLGRDILRFMPQEHLRKLLTDLEKLVAGLQNNPKDEQNTKIAAKLSSIILGMIKDRSLPLTESQLQELGLSTETLEKLTYRLTPGVEAHYRNMNGQEEYKLFMDSDWVLHVGILTKTRDEGDLTKPFMGEDFVSREKVPISVKTVGTEKAKWIYEYTYYKSISLAEADLDEYGFPLHSVKRPSMSEEEYDLLLSKSLSNVVRRFMNPSNPEYDPFSVIPDPKNNFDKFNSGTNQISNDFMNPFTDISTPKQKNSFGTFSF